MIKKYGANFVINVVLLLAGIMFLVLSSTPDVMKWVTRIMGALFLIPSVLFIVLGFARKIEASRSTITLGLMPSAGGLFFGVMMLRSPETFIPILTLLLGIFLCVLALYHLLQMFMVNKTVKLPVWYFAFPVIILICGILVLVVDSLKTQNTVVLMTGIAFVLFNITSLFLHLTDRKIKSLNKAAAPVDVEAKVVEAQEGPTKALESGKK